MNDRSPQVPDNANAQATSESLVARLPCGVLPGFLALLAACTATAGGGSRPQDPVHASSQGEPKPTKVADEPIFKPKEAGHSAANEESMPLQITDVRWQANGACLDVTWTVSNNASRPQSVPPQFVVPEKKKAVADQIARTRGPEYAGNPVMALYTPSQQTIGPKLQRAFSDKLCPVLGQTEEDDLKLVNLERVLVTFQPPN